MAHTHTLSRHSAFAGLVTAHQFKPERLICKGTSAWHSASGWNFVTNKCNSHFGRVAPSLADLGVESGIPRFGTVEFSLTQTYNNSSLGMLTSCTVTLAGAAYVPARQKCLQPGTGALLRRLYPEHTTNF
jgi:hypothetical protein